MRNFRRKILIKAFMLFDPGILALSYVVVAVHIRHLATFSSFAAFMSMRVKVVDILLLLGLFYSWHVIFSAFGLYESKRLGTRRQEAVDVLKATSTAAIIVGLIGTIFRVQMITPAFVAPFWIMAYSIIVLCRSQLRNFLGWIRMHGRNSREMLIVGTNPRAIEFARIIAQRPEFGYHLIGFADEEWSGNRDFRNHGKPIVTDLEHFPNFLRECVVDEVAIALPMKSFYSQSALIVRACQEQGIVVRVLSRIFDFRRSGHGAGEVDETDLATFGANVLEGWPLVVKRLLDVAVSLVFLIILGPLLLAIAILIKFDSPGPVFFVQERVGLSKRKFRMYKFRSMVPDAAGMQAQLEDLNEVAAPAFKIKKDPRVTRIGRFLRRASLDELPQLFNVLTGDMSLVGPRPVALRDYQGFDQDWQRRRFSVRPGITCLWQIKGRSSIPFDKWMELDMEYIDQWSLGLDFKILAKTIPAVVKGTGAA